MFLALVVDRWKSGVTSSFHWPGPLLPMFEAALAGEISYGQNMSASE